jgi:hypothetical protein
VSKSIVDLDIDKIEGEMSFKELKKIMLEQINFYKEKRAKEGA